MLKLIFQLARHKDKKKTIGIDKSVSNGVYFEHKCLNDIKIYQYAGKCDEQQRFKDTIEAAIIFTTE